MKLSTIKSIIADKHALPVISHKPLWVFIKNLSYKRSRSDALTVESSICSKG